MESPSRTGADVDVSVNLAGSSFGKKTSHDSSSSFDACTVVRSTRAQAGDWTASS